MLSIFRLVGRRVLCAVLAVVGVAGVGSVAQGAVLYNLQPDPTDAAAVSSATVMYDANLVSITVAAGLTGTTATQLYSIQNINAAAASGITGNRFQNTDRDAAQTNNTLLTDAVANTYFQFGITGGSPFDVTSLTFDAKQGTAGVATRGYSVQVSVNGGAYTPLGAANVTANRAAAPFDSVSLPTTGTSGITAIDFRVTSTGGGVEYTNISINGAVPEPASMAGLAVGAAALMMRRTRRRH